MGVQPLLRHAKHLPLDRSRKRQSLPPPPNPGTARHDAPDHGHDGEVLSLCSLHKSISSKNR